MWVSSSPSPESTASPAGPSETGPCGVAKQEAYERPRREAEACADRGCNVAIGKSPPSAVRTACFEDQVPPGTERFQRLPDLLFVLCRLRTLVCELDVEDEPRAVELPD